MRHPLAFPLRHHQPGVSERNRRRYLIALGLAAGFGLLAACRPLETTTTLPTATLSVLTATIPPGGRPTLQSATHVAIAVSPTPVSLPSQPTRSILVEGDLAYLGVGPRLMVLDISDPQHPSFVGQTAPLDGTDPKASLIRAITAWNQYVIVTTLTRPEMEGTQGPGGVYVVDRSDPSRPHVVGSRVFEDGAWDVEVLDTYAVVSNGTSGIRILDLADPASLGELALLPIYGQAHELRMSGDLAYVAGGSSVDVIDLSEPSRPVEIDFYQLADYVEGSHLVAWIESIDVSAGVAYLAAYGEFMTFDLSDRTYMRLLGRRRDLARIVQVGFPYAYVFSPTEIPGVLILDISNPSVPLLVGVFQRSSLSPALARSGNTLLIGDERGGLTVVDVSDPTSPVEVGTWVLPDGM